MKSRRTVSEAKGAEPDLVKLCRKIGDPRYMTLDISMVEPSRLRLWTKGGKPKCRKSKAKIKKPDRTIPTTNEKLSRCVRCLTKGGRPVFTRSQVKTVGPSHAKLCKKIVKAKHTVSKVEVEDPSHAKLWIDSRKPTATASKTGKQEPNLPSPKTNTINPSRAKPCNDEKLSMDG